MNKGNRILSLVLIISLCLCMFEFYPIQVAADEPDEETPIYLDTSYSFEERAADLVSRMTLAEKVSQLNTSAPAIPRLGIKANNWWQEALHGAAWVRAVSFPSSLSMSLTWDPDLLFETASIIGDECRAYNTTSGRALSNFCPTINIQRDPRWGRNEEGYGEDPFLVAVLGEQYINGIQGNLDTENVTSPSGEKYLKTIATLKHYAANNSEQNRYTGSSDLDDRTLREYYTYAFREITKKAQPESVMSAYNRVNGIPCAANTYLLDTLLRKTWGFSGYVVSDCEGISWMRNGHNWVPSDPPGIYTQRVTMPQASAFAIMAGTDLACNWTQSGSYGGDYSNNLSRAIEDKVLTDNGVISEDALDVALVRLFTARMKTGEFDPKTFAYSNYTVSSHVETAANVAASLKASQKAIVLLKNDDNTLPINLDEIKSIAVVGKFNDICELGDTNYAGSPTTRVSFKSGLTSALNAKGFDTTNNLKFYNTGSSSVSGYIFNIRQFSINGTTIQATSASVMNNCRAETNNIGYIYDGAYAIYENVDLGQGLTSFTADVSTNGTSGSFKPVVEVRIGGPTGKLIAKAVCNRTSSWTTYVSNTGTVEPDAALEQGVKTICLRFTTDQSSTDSLNLDEIGKADMVIYLAGTGKSAELNVAGENRDRANMDFPANQVDEIKQVVAANPNTVVAIQAVGMMNIGEFADDVKAILFTSFNGQFQGQAMADVLLGNVNADGRLSFTWYADESQLPDILDYEIRPTETKYGRTYQYFRGDVLYPFGYGLSYTSFAYSNMQIDKKNLDANDEFQVSVDVTNTGTVKGDEVVQLYITTPDAPAELQRPIKRLKGFQKISLEPGETKKVTISVKVPDLAFFDEALGRYVVDNGRYGVQIGRSSADIKFEDYIQVTGQLKPVISEVTVRTSQEGDDEKDIPSRVIFGRGKVVIPKVTVTMNDEALYGFIKKGDNRPLPQGMTIEYSSNRPEVVSVDENGVIRTNKGGVATITATVTYDGVSKSAKSVIYVKNDLALTGITVNGNPLSGFSPDIYSYNVVVPIGSAVPQVAATANRENASVVISQATEIPGKAIITVSDELETLIYTINFTIDLTLKDLKVNGTQVIGFSPTRYTYDIKVPSGSDIPQVTAEPNDPNAVVEITQATAIPGVAIITVSAGTSTLTYSINMDYAPPTTVFSFMEGTIDSGWTILNPDPSGYSVVPGMGLRLPTQDSDMYSTGTSWKNVFVRPVEGDWEVVSAVYYSTVPYANYQQNALLVWQDEDNYIKLDYEYNNENLFFQLGQEVASSFSSVATVTYIAPADVPLNIFYKIKKTGNNYTGYYSLDGTNYTVVGSTTITLQNTQIGFYATKNSTNDPIDTYVKYVEIKKILNTDATLKELLVDGVQVAGFDPSITSYDITLPSGTTAVPTVIAIANDSKATVSIEPAESLPGTTNVIVTAEDGITQKVYKINFEVEVSPATVLTAASSVQPGATFAVGIGLDNLEQIVHAYDITLSYDPDVFEYVSAAGADDNIVIVREDKDTVGKVRLFAANIGGVSGASTPVLNANFKAKDGVENTTGIIAVMNAKLGIGPQGTVLQADHDSKSIVIGSSEPTIDKSALITAIDNAQSLYDAAVVGTQPGQYPQAAKDALKAAIDAAIAVRDDSSATQAQVDSAVTALSNAVDIFKAAVIVEVTPDKNANGIIDVGDLAFVAYYYGKEFTDSEWQDAKVVDMNGDGKIDIEDLAYVAMRIDW